MDGIHVDYEWQSRSAQARRRAAFWADVLPGRNHDSARLALSALVMASDGLVIAAGSLLTGLLYHALFLESRRAVDDFANVGILIAIVFIGLNGARNSYRAAQVFATAGRPLHLFAAWCGAFAIALAIGFVTKSTGFASRGATLLFFIGGFAALLASRSLLHHAVRRSRRLSVALKHRVLLIGWEEEIEAFYRRHAVDGSELKVVAQLALRPIDPNDRDRRQLSEDLALATHLARFMDAEDILILLPWTQDDLIGDCVDSLGRVPASIHLGLDGVLRRFNDATILRMGTVANITLVPKPLTLTEQATKRVFDVAVAGLMLVGLAPVLVVVAILIRLDSPGPALFRQTRYGFNQQPFRLHKFRTMGVIENGQAVRQAVANDPRITRVGRVLRRWNVDELPQLIDVLRGDMSLVGPRPHAMAHDQSFEREFNRYARRHNVKPGITGWAQVNGFRGQIRSPDDIRARIEHDLYYIDNWSLWLDIKILALTVLSPRAYRNAG